MNGLFQKTRTITKTSSFLFPALAGGLHARCIHGGVNRVCEWVFRGLVECGWMWGCLRGGQSGDPKAAAASLEGRKGL